MKKFKKILLSTTIITSVLFSTINVFAESERDSKWIYDKKGTIIYDNGGSPLLRDKLHFEQYGVEVFDADGNSLGKIDIEKEDLYSNASDLSLDFPNEVKDNNTTETENFIKNDGVTVKVPIVPVFEEVYKEPITETTTNSIVNQNAFKNEKVIKVTIGSKIGNVNGKNIEMDVAPYIKNGVTMIPLRFVASSLDIPDENIIFNQDSKSVTIVYKNTNIHFLSYEIEIKNGRTFVPFRTLGEYLDLTIDWDNKTKTAIMKGTVNNNFNEEQYNNTNINNNNENQKENKEELTEANIRTMEEEVVRLVNEERVKNGLNPLQIDETLMHNARAKVNDMAENNYFSHYDKNGNSSFAQILGVEEVLTGYTEPNSAINSFMNSPLHKSSILRNTHTKIGVGINLKSGTAIYFDSKAGWQDNYTEWEKWYKNNK
nr:stalk domain-containing protein [uncultured Tyzzerella sp.]